MIFKINLTKKNASYGDALLPGLPSFSPPARMARSGSWIWGTHAGNMQGKFGTNYVLTNGRNKNRDSFLLPCGYIHVAGTFWNLFIYLFILEEQRLLLKQKYSFPMRGCTRNGDAPF